MLTGIALAALLNACAPRVGPRTLTAIITVESGGNPNAIHDNTSGLSYFPNLPERAADLATSLVAAGHSVDLGLSQINSLNLPGLALSVADMFDPCANVRVSSRILTGDYRRAVARFGAGQLALRHAIGAYNTGSIYAGTSYVSKVLAAAETRQSEWPARVVLVARAKPHIYHLRSVTHDIANAGEAIVQRANFTVEATADYGPH